MSTAPQEIAADQLRRLAAVSGGAIQVLSGPDVGWSKSWFSFDVSLDLTGISTEPGGISLRPRERFKISVGPQYPFVAPIVNVPHSRWAGAPHVQWATQLCLYLAPALEWSPEDGMRGLVDRLLSWLERAATASLDPAGQPPHPPIAYPDMAAGFAVIHADIGGLAPQPTSGQPAAAPTTLVGWGGISDDRIDVDAWFTPAEFARRYDGDSLPPVPAGRPTAVACVLLDTPIAFEYPSDVSGLAHGLTSAGLSAEALGDLARQVAVASAAHLEQRGPGRKAKKPPLPPFAVFIGSPSRSGDGHTRQTHLVGFSLDLRTPDLDTLLNALATAGPATSSMNSGDVKLSWLRVYEDRPEVTVRRDHDSPVTALRGKRILILGCGALGAPVAEHCVRAGAEVTVADNGYVTPGILVRQPYYDQDIGQHKAVVLARRLNGIARGPGVAKSVAEDVITAFFAGPAVPDYDLVIDATANAGVRAAIEAARAPNRTKWPPLITMLIGHTATMGLVVTSRPNATGAGHDVLRRVGIASRQPGSGLDDVAAEFFPHPPRTEMFQPEPGCSEPTFTGSAADVTGLASAMLLAAADALERAEHFEPMTGIAIRSPRATADATGASRPAVTPIGWPDDVVERDQSGRYEVRLSQAALTDIRAEVRRRARMHNARVETGGMLIGTIDDGAACIFVDHACPPTPDSLLGEHHFEHGTEGAQELVDHFRASSAHVSGFVGMWHTHPEGAARPSRTDEQGMASLVVPVAGSGRALMLIVGGAKQSWDNWRDDGGKPDVYVRYITSTTAAASASQRPRPPGRYFRAGDSSTSPGDASLRQGLRGWLREMTAALRRRRR